MSLARDRQGECGALWAGESGGHLRHSGVLLSLGAWARLAGLRLAGVRPRLAQLALAQLLRRLRRLCLALTPA